MVSPTYRTLDRPTPAKRQKRKGGQFVKPHPASSIQHWDDPGTSQDVLSYDDPTPVAHEEDPRVDGMGVEEEEAEEDEEALRTRNPTHSTKLLKNAFPAAALCSPLRALPSTAPQNASKNSSYGRG